MKKIYFKHSLITSGKQEDVEREINLFNTKNTEILNVTVTPETINVITTDGCEFPRYIYHICVTYKDRENCTRQCPFVDSCMFWGKTKPNTCNFETCKRYEKIKELMSWRDQLLGV